MSEEDLSLMIPLRDIYDQFMCPICMSEITDCHMTSCGHLFCDRCIRECLNLRHRCPMCMSETTEEKLIKNHHFDQLLERVTTSKRDAARTYMARLLQPPASASPDEQTTQSKSPIELVFQQHARKTLLGYQQYYTELVSKFTKQEAELKSAHAEQSVELRAKLKLDQAGTDLPAASSVALTLVRTPSLEQALKSLATMESELTAKLAQIEAQKNQTIRLLVESFEKHWSSIAPAPFLIPVTVTLSVPRKGFQCLVSLRSADTLNDVKQSLMKRTEDMGDPIVSFGADFGFSLKRPYAATTTATADAKQPVAEKYTNLNVPIMELKIEPGSELQAAGEFTFASERKDPCFSVSFHADMRVDYFRCSDCSLNWLCTPCAKTCHQGHELRPFMVAHKPSYGACYCNRHKGCKIGKK